VVACTLAPAYDLTFSSGPGGEQSMTVMGEGKSPGVEHLGALAKKHGLRSGQAILAEVRAAVAEWPQHAAAAGLSTKAAKLIGGRIAPPAVKAGKPKAKPKAKGAAAAKVPAKSGGGS
jgi:serine/threonine-protein kinase HipA